MSTWESPGKSDEWYTPKYIFDALGCEFDQDVAASPHGAYVPARSYIIADSLDKPWRGFIWMNPPFGGRNGLVPWLEKFVAQGNGICLVPDRTSAPWFQYLARHAGSALFVSPKVKFERPDGSVGKSPGTGTVLFSMGYQGGQALSRADGLGWRVLCREHRS